MHGDRKHSQEPSLVFVPADGGPLRWFALNKRFLVLLGLFLCLCCFTVLWAAWTLYHHEETSARLAELVSRLDALSAQSSQRVNRLVALLAEEREKSRVYAMKLGEMEARLARLDALGERLVISASLDPKEFNFQHPPAFGGAPPRSADGYDWLASNLESLEKHIGITDAQLAAIDYLLRSMRDEKEARPHLWPAEGGWISSRYGRRLDPFTGIPAMHRGIDIANRLGAEVYAASRGIVTFAGRTKDFGYVVEIEHGYGYWTRYAHLASVKVKAGDEVEAGALIGTIGSTGRSTGPHLHYEVHRYDRFLNPISFLPRG